MQSHSYTNPVTTATGLPYGGAASLYTQLGWHVVPLHSVRPDGTCTCEPRHDGKPCKSKGKHPRQNDWPKQATNDTTQAAELFAQYQGSNIGLATGHDFFVLDVDPKNGGDSTLAALLAEHGPLPVTPEQATPSGGSHYLFRMPPGRTVTNAKAGKGLDIRGVGGQIVAAPSRTTASYRWVRAPWNTPLADAPEWLRAKIERASGLPSTPVPDGARGYFPPASSAVLDEARAALKRHGPAVDGDAGGLHTVQAGALLTHDFALTDDEEAWPLLLEWNETCAPPWELEDLRERLRRGRKYGKLPYGCRRTLDTLAAGRKLIADWQASGSDDPTAMIAVARQLRWGDPAARDLFVKELSAATGIGARALAIPPAVNVAEVDAREERSRAYEAGTGNFIDLSAPYATAGRLLLREADSEGRPRLVRWMGEWFQHVDGRNVPISTEEVIRYNYDFLAGCRDLRTGAQVKPDRAMTENLHHAACAAGALPVTTAPAWHPHREEDPPPADVISFPNGLLVLGRPERVFLAPTRRFFTLNSIEFPYEAGAPAPVEWLKFLSQLWPSDAESIETLQEFLGLYLTGDTSHQKILMLVGPKRSGKGTIARILQSLVGIGNYCSPTLNGLGGQFGAESLIGKRLAVISDARLGTRADVSAVAERLLSISGEDTQTVDRKHRTSWTAKLDVRFMLLTNEVPALLDQSGALASRFVVLNIVPSFYGREDLGLSARLLKELPGILLWALEGLDRLRARGHFRQPASASDAVAQLETLGSPIKAFVADRCELVPGASVDVRTLYSEWCRWAEGQGREKPGTAAIFGRNLSSAFPGVTTTRPRVNGEQVKHYSGIRLKVLDLQAA